MILKMVDQKRMVVLSAGSRMVLLTCEPYRVSTHPDPRKACADLEAAGGDPAEVEGDPAIRCTMHYDPVRATAFGRWDGRPIRYRHNFGNSCTMRLETGSLFSF
ncbi:SSI family serine proteinase inhibitor [Nonomuraea sp. NPDC059194]|uniref:SSI family serine proteinase inhibitor n=1 Tax=Nonomuraea sp. NPDC059194 TaxID=3346764 RepID=UPI0036C21461